MTIRDLNPGAIIQMLAEQIYIDDKQTCKVGIREVTEFRVRRGNQRTALWTGAAQVQSWLDRAQWIENPEDEDGDDAGGTESAELAPPDPPEPDFDPENIFNLASIRQSVEHDRRLRRS